MLDVFTLTWKRCDKVKNRPPTYLEMLPAVWKQAEPSRNCPSPGTGTVGWRDSLPKRSGPGSSLKPRLLHYVPRVPSATGGIKSHVDTLGGHDSAHHPCSLAGVGDKPKLTRVSGKGGEAGHPGPTTAWEENPSVLSHAASRGWCRGPPSHPAGKQGRGSPSPVPSGPPADCV